MVHEKEVALAHWMNVCHGTAVGGGGSEGRGPAVAQEPDQGGPETVAGASGRTPGWGRGTGMGFRL